MAAITNIEPERTALISGQATQQYPTGVVFVYLTEDVEDAREVVKAYHRHGS